MKTRVSLVLFAAAAMAVSAAASDRDRRFHMQIGHPFNNLEIEVRGDVQFTDDDRDVRTLSPGGYLLLEEGGWLQRKRTYEVKADSGGNLSRSYRFGGREQTMDAEARAWVAGTMLALIRQTGIGAGERVQRMLARGGPAAVFNEIGQIDSDGTRRVYIGELVSRGRLGEADLRESMRAARKIGSDGDKAALLIEVAPQCLRPNVREAWFSTAATIGSDGDKANALRQAIQRNGGDPDTLALAARTAAGIGSDGDKSAVLSDIAAVYRPEARQAFFRACATIGSDGDRRHVLESMLKSAHGDRETLAEALRCARDIGSDGDKAAVLSEAARMDLGGDAVRRAFFEAADSVGSDGDRAAVLNAVLRMQRDSAPVVAAVAASAKNIGSDGDKAGVLGRLAEGRVLDADTSRVFFEAVNSIGSDSDRAGVLTRLLKRTGLPSGTVVGAIESAAGIGSDGDKATVMVSAALTYGSDPSVRAALERALPSLHSDGDYRRVSVALNQRR